MIETLFILRHGQTEWNVAQRMQGRLDSALTDEGRRQAAQHGRTLQRVGGVDRLLASPLGRTRDTAQLVNAALGVRLDFDPALMERDCGAWSGLTLDEIEQRYPGDWAERRRDPYFHRPPGGENLDDMRGRVAGLLEHLCREPSARIALVTHGVMSRVILTHLLALTPAAAIRVKHPNALFYRLEFAADGVRELSSMPAADHGRDRPPSAVRVSHFLDGQGPVAGLLHQSDSETIGGPDKNTTSD
ncbi:MAG: histidine phosphatase family protein [Pseudomonadales bacterium]